MRCTIVSLLCTFVVCAALSQPFTYQGSLLDTGLPANGGYSITFRLFDRHDSGNQIGNTVVESVTASKGLFSAYLYFGENLFDGNERFLEIQVDDQVLTPRIELTPVPYAAYALKPWQTQNTVIYYTGGNVGIGTSDPSFPLTFGSQLGGKIALWAFGNAMFGLALQTNVMQLLTPSSQQDIVFGSGDSFALIETMRVKGNGRVGIGTNSPGSQLDVRGTARVRTTFEVVDTSQNVRVLAGVSNGAGRIDTYNTNGTHMNYIGQDGGTNFPMMGVMNSAQTQVTGGIKRDTASGTVVFANVKNFVEPNRNDPTTDIWYASLEGPEAAMYVRGSGRLANGEAQIVLPDHFLSMIVPGSLTVHLTPGSRNSKGLGYEYGPNGITVFELAGGKGAYEFSWTVTSVRKGFENYRVLRPWDEIAPVETDREKAWQARLKEIEEKTAIK